jgi:Protein of unknown function (DUF2889)
MALSPPRRSPTPRRTGHRRLPPQRLRTQQLGTGKIGRPETGGRAVPRRRVGGSLRRGSSRGAPPRSGSKPAEAGQCDQARYVAERKAHAPLLLAGTDGPLDVSQPRRSARPDPCPPDRSSRLPPKRRPWGHRRPPDRHQIVCFANAFRGEIAPGEPIHDIWLRLTLDDELTVIGAEAVTAGPFCGRPCPRIHQARRAQDRSGLAAGRAGAPRRRSGVYASGRAARAARDHQTIHAWRARHEPEAASDRPPPLLDSCHALARDGEVVRTHFPRWYTRPGSEPGA